ncbi:MAG: hypothetical protein IRZ26_06735 [Clostridia bacterium]|nr:hypothetical protein [Clostridia bacterium]MCL6521489.1 hypothetical protein [Bacillota bacterium]
MQGSRAGSGRAGRTLERPAPPPRPEKRRRPEARPGPGGTRRFLAATGLVWLMAVAAVAIHVQITGAGYRLDQEAGRLAQLRQEETLLAARVESLAAPQRILGLAESQLGMVAPPGRPLPLRPGEPAGPPPAAGGRQEVVRLPPPPEPSPARAAAQAWWENALRFARTLWRLGR